MVKIILKFLGFCIETISNHLGGSLDSWMLAGCSADHVSAGSSGRKGILTGAPSTHMRLDSPAVSEIVFAQAAAGARQFSLCFVGAAFGNTQ